MSVQNTDLFWSSNTGIHFTFDIYKVSEVVQKQNKISNMTIVRGRDYLRWIGDWSVDLGDGHCSFIFIVDFKITIAFSSLSLGYFRLFDLQ